MAVSPKAILDAECTVTSLEAAVDAAWATEDLLARAKNIDALNARVEACPPSPHASRMVRHLVAVNAFDAGVDSPDLLDTVLREALAANDRVAYLQAAWRWQSLSPTNREFLIVSHTVNDLVGRILREAGDALPPMSDRDLAGLALFSHRLCAAVVESGMATTNTTTMTRLRSAGLDCAARLGDGVSVGRLIVAIARDGFAGNAGDDQEKIERLFAHAALLDDRSPLDAVRDAVDSLSAKFPNGVQRRRLQADIAIALSASRRLDEAEAAAVRCLQIARAMPGDEVIDWCALAEHAVALARGDGNVAEQVQDDLRTADHSANPLLALVALDLVESARAMGVTPSLPLSPKYDLIGAPEVLRRCQLIATASDGLSFSRAMVLRSGFMTASLRQALAACLEPKLRANPNWFNANAIALAMYAIGPLTTPEATRLRISGSRALLLDPPLTTGASYRVVVDESLIPIVNAPLGAVTEPQRSEAMLLLLRAAIDVGDNGAVATWRQRAVARGVVLPASLADRSAVIMPKSEAKNPTVASTALFQLYLGWSNIELEQNQVRRSANDVDFWHTLATVTPTIQPRARRETQLAALFASARTLVGTESAVDQENPTCGKHWLATFEAANGLVNYSMNKRVNGLIPNNANLMRFLEGLGPSDYSGPPPDLRREARDLGETIIDLERLLVVHAALGSDEHALTALSLIDDAQAKLPAATTECASPAADLARLSPSAQEAVLTLLARRRGQLTDLESMRMLARALNSRDRDEAIYYVANASAQIGPRRTLDAVRRALFRARRSLDVEMVRKFQVEEIAAQQEVWMVTDSAPIISVDEIAHRLDEAKARLAEGEGLFAWFPVHRFTKRAAFVNVLLTRTRFEVVSVAPPTDWKNIADGLDIYGIADASRLPKFDVLKAYQTYQTTLGGFKNLPHRIYVIAAPTDIPLGVLVERLVRPTTHVVRPTTRAITYRSVVFFQDAHEIAYLGASLRVPEFRPTPELPASKAIVLASPNYGPPLMPTPARLDPMLRNRLGHQEEPAKNTCGQPPLPAFFQDGAANMGDSVQLHVGNAASEDVLAELSNSEQLKRASLLAFYAHGVQANGGRRGSALTRAIALAPTPGCDGNRDLAGSTSDGFLVPDEIATLALGAGTFVVLAGCNTAEEDRALQQSRLPQAFFAAGAPVVVGSVKEVPADSTAAFLRYIASDRTTEDPVSMITTAIRLVGRSQVSDEAARWAHPAFWGAWRIELP